MRRQDYYRILERCQRGSIHITPWLAWFLDTLLATVDRALAIIDQTVFKSRFWQRFQPAGLSAEQIKVLNRLLDLLAKGYLEKLPGGGRSTRYHIAILSETTGIDKN